MAKDTGLFDAVSQEGVRTCAVHRETCNDLFSAVAGRVSTVVFRWTVTILSGVAVAFGMWLWLWTTSRCDRTDGDVADMMRRTIKIEADLEHIKAAQMDAKAELKATRVEMLDEFRRLREAIGRGH